MAKLSASTAHLPRNGRTRLHMTVMKPGPQPMVPGSITTIIIDPIPGSEDSPRQLAFTTSPGTTPSRHYQSCDAPGGEGVPGIGGPAPCRLALGENARELEKGVLIQGGAELAPFSPIESGYSQKSDAGNESFFSFPASHLFFEVRKAPYGGNATRLACACSEHRAPRHRQQAEEPQATRQRLGRCP